MEFPFYTGEIGNLKKHNADQTFKHKEDPPPGKDLYNNAWGCFEVRGRDPGAAFALWLTAPTTGSVGQVSMPNVYPTAQSNSVYKYKPYSFTNREQSTLSLIDAAFWSLLDNP